MGILVGVAGLLAVGGISWWFSGPEVSVGYGAEVSGISAETFRELYPRLVVHMSHNAHQVAVLYAALGLMSLTLTTVGLRRGARWAWYGSWVLVAAPTAIGLQYLGGELSFDNVGLLAIGGVALLGQLMARP
jgi:hypothetical protein